jgi:hypothetical protein
MAIVVDDVKIYTLNIAVNDILGNSKDDHFILT